jgi:hypothetical protein
VSARTRSSNRAAWRSLEQAGVVITRGNSPELVREFYQVYLQWIEWRARQRKMPAALARWRARQVEPFQKFATVASRLGADCQIWVASWDGRPVGTAINLYAGESAVGWRSFTDRSVPSVACHDHGTTLRGFLPRGWDHPVASNGTTRRVVPVVFAVFLLGCRQVVGLGGWGGWCSGRSA